MRDLFRRYREAQAHIAANAQPDKVEQDQLIFAHGFLMGAELYGAAAAVERAYRRSFPDAEFPLFAPE